MPPLNTNTSIVDFLKSRGEDSSFGARKKLAQRFGISNFRGSASQNTQLLNTLRSQGPAPSPISNTTPTAQPAQVSTQTRTSAVPTQQATPTPTRATQAPAQQVLAQRGNQPSPRDALVERLTSAISSIQSFNPTERRNELERERGVQQARQEVGTLERQRSQTLNLLDNLENDLKLRTGGFTVTEASRRRLLAEEQSPILRDLGILDRSIGTAESALSREEGAIGQILRDERQRALDPLQTLSTEVGLRGDIDDLFEGDEARGRESAVVDLINQGLTDPLQLFEVLNFDEAGNRIGDIGINEIMQTTQLFEPKERDTQVVSSNGRQTLVDTQTGETIADLGEDLDATLRKLNAANNTRLTDARIRELNDKITSRAKELEQQTQTEIETNDNVSQRIQQIPDAGGRDKAVSAVATFKNAQIVLDALDNVNTGPISGRAQGGTSILGIPIPGLQSINLTSKSFNEFQAATTIFTASFIKAISGVQVSDRERVFLTNALPTVEKTEAQNRAGIKTVLNFLENDLETRLGIDIQDFDDIPKPHKEDELDALIDENITDGSVSSTPSILR